MNKQELFMKKIESYYESDKEKLKHDKQGFMNNIQSYTKEDLIDIISKIIDENIELKIQKLCFEHLKTCVFGE